MEEKAKPCFISISILKKDIKNDFTYIISVFLLNNQKRRKEFKNQNQLCLKSLREVDDLRIGKIE